MQQFLIVSYLCVLSLHAQTLSLSRQGSGPVPAGSPVTLNVVLSGNSVAVAAQWNLSADVPGTVIQGASLTPDTLAQGASTACVPTGQICLIYNMKGTVVLPNAAIATITVTVPTSGSPVTVTLSNALGADATGSAVAMLGPSVTIPISGPATPPSFANAVDFGQFSPAANITTPSFDPKGGNFVALKVICGGCQPGQSSVNAVSLGSQTMTHGALVSANGVADVWTLVGSAPLTASTFTIATGGIANLQVQAYSAKSVASVVATTNVVNLGNAMATTTVTATAGDLLVALTNATPPFSSDTGTVRLTGIADQTAIAGSNTIHTEVDGQGPAFGNAIIVLDLKGSSAVVTVGVNVTGTTPTQAVLSYTAPDTNPCLVAISESASLSPLVHDVDPTLFTGSNLDNRAGSVSSGTKRIFVAGTRDAETGIGGSNYSRALQQNTKHYYKVTCGTVASSGTFTTAIAPLGNTYRDLPYINSNGSLVIPSVNDDPAQTIVDPHTGTLLKKLNTVEQLFHDDLGNPNLLSLYSGGNTHMCANTPSGPGNGFLCGFQSGAGNLMYITPDGNTTELGYITVTPGNFQGAKQNPNISADGHFYFLSGDSTGHIIMIKGTYVGDYTATSPQNSANITWQNITPYPNDLSTQMAAFAPDFNQAAGWSWLDVEAVGGHWALTGFRRANQDTPGWYMVVDVSTGLLAGMLNAETGPAFSFCGLHTSYTMADQPIVQLAFHGDWGGPAPWNGPFTTTLTQAVGTTDTTFQISSANLSMPNGGPSLLPVVGTLLSFISGNGERVLVTAVNGTTLTVQRASLPRFINPWENPADHPAMTHAAGDTLRAECTDEGYDGGSHGEYWKFLQDPHGTGSAIVYEVPGGSSGHDDFDSAVQVGEGWTVRQGPLMTEVGQPGQSLPISAFFANSAGECDGTGCSQHTTKHTIGANYFTDGLPWNGIGVDSGVTNISGQLYKYPFPYGDGNWPPALRDIHRKQMPTRATTGAVSLVDVSGPASVLSDQPADSYKYCVAYKAGECRPNSAKGDMFANIPGTLDKMGCYGSDNPNPNVHDLCITDMPAWGNAMVQIGYTANHEGLGILPGQADPFGPGTIGAGYSRVVSEGLGGPKASSELFKTLPDGSWGIFQVYSLPYVMMVKMPPFVKDNVHRDYFVRSSLSLTPPAGLNVASAVVEFGYAEQGASNVFHCTSRNEACVSVSGAIDDTNPFSYEQSDTFTPMPCTTTCTITLPVAPSHVAYYHAKYLNSSGAQVAEDFGVSTESALISLSQVH